MGGGVYCVWYYTCRFTKSMSKPNTTMLMLSLLVCVHRVVHSCCIVLMILLIESMNNLCSTVASCGWVALLLSNSILIVGIGISLYGIASLNCLALLCMVVMCFIILSLITLGSPVFPYVLCWYVCLPA